MAASGSTARRPAVKISVRRRLRSLAMERSAGFMLFAFTPDAVCLSSRKGGETPPLQPKRHQPGLIEPHYLYALIPGPLDSTAEGRGVDILFHLGGIDNPPWRANFHQVIELLGISDGQTDAAGGVCFTGENPAVDVIRPLEV